MQRLALLLVLAACGHHASIVVEAATAERKPDDRVEVTLSVTSNGQNDWPDDREFCVVVEWKETAKLSTTATTNAPYLGTPDANLPALDSVKQCVKQGLPTRERVTYTLLSSKPVPTGSTILAYLVEPPTHDVDGGGPKIARDYTTRIASP